MKQMVEALKPCPFCGGTAEIEKAGDRRQSMIIACTYCGCRAESNDELGSSPDVWEWNRRPEAATAPSHAEGAQKPVAWRYEYLHETAGSEKKMWLRGYTDRDPSAAKRIRNVTPLYAHPLPAASFQAGAEAKNCQLCADGWPKHKRYDGKYFHSLPEPVPDFICEKQD